MPQVRGDKVFPSGVQSLKRAEKPSASGFIPLTMRVRADMARDSHEKASTQTDTPRRINEADLADGMAKLFVLRDASVLLPAHD